MRDQPEPPREAAREAEAVQVDDRGACGRSWRGCRSRGSGTAAARAVPRSRARITCATCAPICLAAGATPGTGLPSALHASRGRRRRRSPDARARVRSGATGTRPARSSGTSSVRAERRGGDARGPQHRARGDAFARRARTPSRIDRATPACRCARRRRGAASCARAFADSDSGNVGEHARPGFEQQHARVARVDVAELACAACGARSPRACRRVRRRSGRRRRRRRSATPRARRDRARASARSKASRMRRRIASASSSVFRPGACGAHSSWPK